MIKKNKIKQMVSKARLRLTYLKALNYMGFGLIIGAGVSLLIAVLALAVPIVDEYVYIILAPLLGMISALIVALIFMPSKSKAALKLDESANLKERITTAYELIANDDEVSKAVINDAYTHAEGIKISKLFPVKIGIKKVGIFALLLALTFAVGLINTPAKDAAKRREQIASTIKEERDVIKQLEKEIKNNPELTKEEKEELLKTIKDGLDEIKEAKSDDAIKKAEQKLVKKLEQELNNVDKKDMLAKSLAKAAVDLNNKIPKNMKSEAKEQLARKLDEIKKAEEDAKELLNQANEEMKKNGEIPEELQKKLSEALKNAADELSSEELAKLASQMSNSLTKEQLDQLASSLKNASAEQIAASISNASMSVASANAFANNNQNGQNGQNNSNSSGNAAGQNMAQGQGSGQGQGQGQGVGQGNGQGSGGKGGGWNRGSKNGVQGNSAFNGDYVSVPDDMQNDENLKGQNNGGKSYNSKGGPSVTWSGQNIDYHNVIGDYESKAYERISDDKVPYSMQEYVRNYFSELNQ